MKSPKYIVICVFCVAMSNCNAPKIESNIKPSGDWSSKAEKPNKEGNNLDSTSLEEEFKQFLKAHKKYRAEGFDFPVGIPDAKNYYNAQGFGENNHLGDDWNGTGGGNSDLGDPVYAVANGYVSAAYDAGGGWGNVLRIIHQVGENSYVESLYAHLDSMMVSPKTGIVKGEQIGTIGNANGAYLAHLHLEIRHQVQQTLGGGYSLDSAGYLNPTQFINSNRKIMWKMVE